MSIAANASRKDRPGDQSRENWPTEGIVLAHVLEQHPRRLTLVELAREVDAADRDAVLRRAVDNLTAARFLSQEGADLVPAPAVIDFDQETVTGA